MQTQRAITDPGYDEIGGIKLDFSKKLFNDLSATPVLERGIFKIAALDSPALLSQGEYPELFSKYNLTSSISVKNLVNKIKNPHNLPDKEFQGYRLVYTSDLNEMGTITNGKFNINVPAIDFLGNRLNQSPANYIGHTHRASGNDLLVYPKEYADKEEDKQKNMIAVSTNLTGVSPEDTVEISAMLERSECFSIEESEYYAGSDVNVKMSTDLIIGDRIKNNRRGCVMYIVLGFK